MSLKVQSPCKVNLILNILGKRPDGFHELETVMLPAPVHDTLQFRRAASGIELTCSDPSLPTGNTNLVWRAANVYLEAAGIPQGVRIHLDKRIPIGAGLGGGSANAAVTLQAINELFGHKLAPERLVALAAMLGSDVPFFLQTRPGLAIGRGEQVTSLDPFPALRGLWLVLFYPGFGVSTAWAYQNLGHYKEALNGKPGRASELVKQLHKQDPTSAFNSLYNSLEAPVLPKYPLLSIARDFMRKHGALVSMMSGSGSTVFGFSPSKKEAGALVSALQSEFARSWTSAVEIAN